MNPNPNIDTDKTKALVDNDTIFLDNAHYELIMKCHRMAQYGIIHKRISEGTRHALTFGSALHLALKYRYRYCRDKRISEEDEVRQFLIIEEFYKDKPVPVGEYRTPGFAQEVISQYNKFYPEEPFFIISLNARENEKNTPLVEEGFAFPLGRVGDYKIVWKGRLDLAIEEHGDIWVMDHKSTSVGGEFYMTEYFTSNQMKGYTWALRELFGGEVTVKGAMINALVCRKPTRTGKGIEFMRQKFEYDADILAEWLRNTLSIMSDFLYSAERNYFPMMTSQCNGRFSPCQYRDVCAMSPQTRLQWLFSDAFKDDVWDPLHEDEVDLEKIHNSPIPKDYKRIELVDPSVAVSREMNSVMKDILGL